MNNKVFALRELTSLCGGGGETVNKQINITNNLSSGVGYYKVKSYLGAVFDKVIYRNLSLLKQHLN